MKKILVIGSINMDLVTQLNVTPRVGETVLGKGFSQIPGGKGANQAVSIGKLGGDVTMLGRVGEDAFGERLLQNLKRNGVNTQFVSKVNNFPTGLALIMVNDDGDNSIVVISGANFSLTSDEIKEEVFDGFDFVLAQLETPIEVIEKVFEIAKKKGIYTILNPAPSRKLSQKLISNIDLLIPNEIEFEELTGHAASNSKELEKGAKMLFDKNLGSILITLGKEGARYFDCNGKDIRIPGYLVDAIDTTAAGDSFIGGFMSSISKGETIEDAMKFAMKVGAITVSRHGAQSSLPELIEVELFKGIKRRTL